MGSDPETFLIVLISIATNLTDYPTLKTEGGLMVVEWKMKTASNAISRFELLVKQNGEEGEISTVDFQQGRLFWC